MTNEVQQRGDNALRCPPCRTVSGKLVPVGTIAYRPLGNQAHHNTESPALITIFTERARIRIIVSAFGDP